MNTAGVEKERQKARDMASTKGVTEVQVELANAKEALRGLERRASVNRLALQSALEEQARA